MRQVAIPNSLPGGKPPTPPPGTHRLLSIAGETMGTTWSLECFTPPGLTGDAVRALVESRLDLLVRQMSHWRGDSDLARFNRADPGAAVSLPAEFFHVLNAALQIAQETGGAFDPTLGEVVNAWGFGPPGPHPELIHPPGRWRKILLDPAAQSAIQPGGAILDLSAIAKGFAVDHVAVQLDSLGIGSYLLEIGGELKSRGVKPDGQPWWVLIEPPPGMPPAGEIIIALYNNAVATSGDYRRYVERAGERLPHTLDPLTAAPVRSPLASVSVLHADAMRADAYATALTVLGAARGLTLSDQLGLPAVFLLREDGRMRTLKSRAFQAMLDED